MGAAASRDSAEPVLAGDLEPLVEKLARSEFGARFGPSSPWEGLAEADRKRLRGAARQILCAIRAAGYMVSRAEAAAAEERAPEPDEELPRCQQRAERFLHSGEPLLAYNTVQQGLETWPEDLRLRQLQSLALARSGAIERANQALQGLRAEGHADPETLGLLARTHKDLGMSATDANARAVHLTAAFDLYEEAHRRAVRDGDVAEAYYTGINAATMAFLRRDEGRARAIAGHVRSLCTEEIRHVETGGAAYWIHATLAEAALILGDREEAKARYETAARCGGSRYGDVASTRGQARLLLASMGEDDAWLDDVLRMPPVLLYAGHMIDPPERRGGAFPPATEPVVREEIRRRLERIRPLAAYGSAACGADILCLEAMLDLGGEIHVVLPFPPETFRKESVDFAPGGNWGERFERVLGAAETVFVASDNHAEADAAVFQYANLILTGMGRLRSQLLGTSLLGLAVWDGGPAGGVGGTADVVELWRRRGIAIEVVDMAGIRASSLGETAPFPPRGKATRRPQSPVGARPSYEIKAMLFSDAVGYSKFTEEQVAVFIDRFLGAVAELNERTRHPPIYAQTAGDGFYFVFRDAADAGHYALELSELVRANDWAGYGLPPTFDIRIGVHCGPVFCGRDPITKLPMYTGSHTSRTARIEPITPPGQVYASSAFAAVASATGIDDLRFSYIGRTRLAKQYGSLPLYHMQRPPRW
jgi:tetratricopeptide (TPR) repeat protein